MLLSAFPDCRLHDPQFHSGGGPKSVPEGTNLLHSHPGFFNAPFPLSTLQSPPQQSKESTADQQISLQLKTTESNSMFAKEPAKSIQTSPEKVQKVLNDISNIAASLSHSRLNKTTKKHSRKKSPKPNTGNLNLWIIEYL